MQSDEDSIMTYFSQFVRPDKMAMPIQQLSDLRLIISSERCVRMWLCVCVCVNRPYRAYRQERRPCVCVCVYACIQPSESAHIMVTVCVTLCAHLITHCRTCMCS